MIVGRKAKRVIVHFSALLCYNIHPIPSAISKHKDQPMIRLIAVLCALPLGLNAAPKVLTDIAPIHSLVAQVMDEVGTPDILLPPGADPHSYSLRPSDAQRLSQADVVIWVGHGLTPWLDDPLATLAPRARKLALLETAGWTALSMREIDHNDHGNIDPHGWLDPAVAQAWLATITDALADVDPENAATYRTNAAQATRAIEMLQRDIAAQIAPVAGRAYILPHDGYRYFETRFGLMAAGMIANSGAQPPGPAHIADLQRQLRRDSIDCVLTDAEIGTKWAHVISEGRTVKSAHLDASGTTLVPGPALYETLLRNMADAFAACLS